MTNESLNDLRDAATSILFGAKPVSGDSQMSTIENWRIRNLANALKTANDKNVTDSAHFYEKRLQPMKNSSKVTEREQSSDTLIDKTAFKKAWQRFTWREDEDIAYQFIQEYLYHALKQNAQSGEITVVDEEKILLEIMRGMVGHGLHLINGHKPAAMDVLSRLKREGYLSSTKREIVDGWQPIATAPKDRNGADGLILVCWENSGMYPVISRWLKGREAWTMPFNKPVNPPTHWMELPKPFNSIEGQKP